MGAHDVTADVTGSVVLIELLVDYLKAEVYSDIDVHTTKQENFDDPSSDYILDYDEVFNDEND